MVFPFARHVSERGHGHPDGFRFSKLNWGPNALRWAYRLLLAYACVRPQSEQNSSLLTRVYMPAIRNRHRQSVEIIPLHESRLECRVPEHRTRCWWT
jgi:hypothetical protein